MLKYPLIGDYFTVNAGSEPSSFTVTVIIFPACAFSSGSDTFPHLCSDVTHPFVFCVNTTSLEAEETPPSAPAV